MDRGEPREQVATGLTVYPVRTADGRVVWVAVPRGEGRR